MNELIKIINKIRRLYNYDNKNLIIILAVIIGLYLLSPIMSSIIVRIGKIITRNKYKSKESPFYRPIKLWIKILGLYLGLSMLNISIFTIAVVGKIFKISTILVIAYGFDNIIGINSNFLKKFKEKTGNNASVDVIRKILRVLIYIIAGFMITSECGYNLTGLITGLGLGSAILALAAQDMFKSLLAGFVIVSEKPFVIGDWIEIDKYSGSVVDIKFRSTKIKATNNTVITIPNSTITNTYVINWSRLEGKRRYETNIALNSDISSEKMERIEKTLIERLKQNNNVDSESVQVHFSNINMGYNSLYIYMYVNTGDYTKSLDIQEEVNYIIVNVLNEEQVNDLKINKAIFA